MFLRPIYMYKLVVKISSRGMNFLEKPIFCETISGFKRFWALWPAEYEHAQMQLAASYGE